jgi:hypothetical protein
MERSLNATENWFRGTRFFDFKEDFVDGRVILPDPGPLSYRGSGSRSFLYSTANDSRASNLPFKDTAEYRSSSTFEKVYPICGTDGYFSLKPSSDMKLYLVAIDLGGRNIVARVIDIVNQVDIIDAACWREITGANCPAGQVVLENKRYPGMVLLVSGDKTSVNIGVRGSNIKESCWEKAPANTTFQGIPSARMRTGEDAQIRRGWDLSDDNRSWGPVEQQSYELEPQYTRSWEECAEKAAQNPKANGFVFVGISESGNCKTKVGGYWNENRDRYAAEAHRNIISGKF